MSRNFKFVLLIGFLFVMTVPTALFVYSQSAPGTLPECVTTLIVDSAPSNLADAQTALSRADRAMGGANQQTIRSCFSWRGIKLPLGSPLREARFLRELEKARGPSHVLSGASLTRLKAERHPQQ